MMKTALVALMLTAGGLAGLGLLLGCDDDRKMRHSSPKAVYVAQPRHQPEPQPTYVIVREAPPKVIVERRPSPPASGYIWIEGYWHWDSHRYAWQAGRWVRPPQERAIWIAPVYERHEQGYRYTPGRWRDDHKDDDRGRGGDSRGGKDDDRGGKDDDRGRDDRRGR